jgi:hypothetical protein
MADNIFRAPPIYLKGKKVAEITDTSFEIMTNNANQYGTDGVLGQSRGIIESKLDFGTVVPIAGMEIDIDTIIANQETVGIGVVVNGKNQIVTGTISGVTYSGDSKTGECKGKYQFIGGAPQLV